MTNELKYPPSQVFSSRSETVGAPLLRLLQEPALSLPKGAGTILPIL
jgi:hypothetical protein